VEDSIKPPALAGLEGFEPWDRAVHAPENREVNVAFVSVRVGGAVGFNKACYKMWGEPRMVHAKQLTSKTGEPAASTPTTSSSKGVRSDSFDSWPLAKFIDFYLLSSLGVLGIGELAAGHRQHAIGSPSVVRASWMRGPF
jgi:hypothetical protein